MYVMSDSGDTNENIVTAIVIEATHRRRGHKEWSRALLFITRLLVTRVRWTNNTDHIRVNDAVRTFFANNHHVCPGCHSAVDTLSPFPHISHEHDSTGDVVRADNHEGVIGDLCHDTEMIFATPSKRRGQRHGARAEHKHRSR
jgi:hypothetical protein